MGPVRALREGPVSIFAASLDRVEPLDQLLSADELARADRFRFPQHRDRYVAGRGLLRRLLAERIGVAPRSLEFESNRWGKPHLVGHPAVAFNMSHSDDRGLFAFGTDCEIGVDVEHLRPVDPLTLAHHYFSQPERRELADLPRSRRLEAFFNGWVRKEAVIKADGRGLSMPLDCFSVRLMGRPQIYVPPPHQAPGATWELMVVDVGSTARAAVAVRRVPGSALLQQPA